MSHEIELLQSQVEVLNMEISKLKDSKQQLELVIKSTGVGIWDWYVQTGKTIYNARWANIIGYQLEELSPVSIETWMKHAHPDDLEESGRLLEEHWAGGTEYYICESRMKHKDGHWVWVHDTGQVIEWESNGSPKRMIGTHLDITELVIQNEEKEKRAAELVIANIELAFQNEEKEKRAIELLQAQKMESIGQLTAGIAHDFNNMLGAMLGYTEMLTLSGPDKIPLSDSDQKYITQIQIAANRAKELVSQMRLFSASGLEPKIGNTPTTILQPMINEINGLLRATIPSTIEINNYIKNDSLKVKMQPVHLHQILMNLVINAWQVMSEYGRIDINAALSTSSGVCTSCHQRYKGEYVNLSVSNSGSSIPPDVLAQIFNPFFTTKKQGNNSGMGLSVVHGLVHEQGGHIRVESTIEGGTIFNILLTPVRSEEPSSKIANVPSIGNIKGLHIMVVDDESTLAALLDDYLTAQGANVTAFTDPSLAWEAFQQIGDSIDLVITDETMPGISGMLLAQKLLTLKPDLPIVLCTGYSEYATAESVEKIGIAGFFDKPFKMSEILLKIQELCKLKV
ncbi:PAS domain-containing protein [Paraglaciecola sp. 25GB23A]|uniref:hybrid sensor histidine kinase/response regulator n=1 Tax=Paraglaciecola sp. 25GB23A TaxID=3156068 RepID=UPI0032AE9C1A